MEKKETLTTIAAMVKTTVTTRKYAPRKSTPSTIHQLSKNHVTLQDCCADEDNKSNVEYPRQALSNGKDEQGEEHTSNSKEVDGNFKTKRHEEVLDTTINHPNDTFERKLKRKKRQHSIRLPSEYSNNSYDDDDDDDFQDNVDQRQTTSNPYHGIKGKSDDESITGSASTVQSKESLRDPCNAYHGVKGERDDESTTGSASAVQSKESLRDPCSMGSVELLQAVRGYCALPADWMKRYSSKYVQQIEDFSGGYKLFSSYQGQQHEQEMRGAEQKERAEGYDEEKVQSALLENKRMILVSMIPAVEHLEEQKAKETEYIHDMTRCRVEKTRSASSNGTEYVHYDIHTQEKVSDEEYKRRYLNIIHCTASKKRRYDAVTSIITSTIGSVSSSLFSTGNEVAKKMSTSQKPSDEVKTEVSREIKSVTNIMLSPPSSDARDASDDHSDMSECTTTPESEDIRGAMPNSTQSNSCVKQTCTNDESQTVDHSIKNETILSTSIEPPLFPVRGEVSSGPDIARARERLWNAMDAALAEYSNDVMEFIECEGKRR